MLTGTVRTGTGNAADNAITGNAGANRLRGLGGNDTLRGEGGDDVLEGGAGRDLLEGGEGGDTLSGGNGADTLDGGAGDDILEGGKGRDLMTGGAGRDEFRFRAGDTGATADSADRIADFVSGEDRLDLRGLGTGLFFDPGGALTGAAGQVVYVRSERLVLGDTEGDGVADFAIRLMNRPTALTADDFVLI